MTEQEEVVANEIGRILAVYLDDCIEAARVRVLDFQEEMINQIDSEIES